MNIDKQLMADLKPSFSEEDIDRMKLYFEVNEQCNEALNEWFQQELKDHRVFGPFMASQSPEMMKERNKLSQELTRNAIYQGDWEPYITDLIMQGTMYAKLGLEFREWYVIISKAKDFLLPEITSIYRGDQVKMLWAFTGLSKLTDYAMQIIAEAYFIEKRETELSQDKKQIALNKELEDFAYVVSHDLKSPLRGIAKISEWLEADYADKLDEDGKSQLEMLRRRVHRLDSLIDGILEYSRLGRARTEAKAIDMNALLKEIVELNANMRSVNVKVAPNLPTIQFVRPKMVQVFSNLISNAIKYNDKRKIEIEIGYEEQPDQHEFWVKDNGLGIEEAYREKVFKIFQTLQPKDDVESTGIGLSIVQKIIHDVNGEIWIESEMGQGTTFYFTIPKKNDSQTLKVN